VRPSFVIAALACLALVGCSKTLSRSRAADLINRNTVFSKPNTARIPVGNIWWDWRNISSATYVYDGDTYVLKPLIDAGLIKYRESGQKEGYWNKEYIFELTPLGKSLSSSWTTTKDALPSGATFMGDRCWTTWGTGGEPCHKSQGTLYTFVIAKRKVDAVTGILTDPGGKTAVADFNWEWKKIFDRLGGGTTVQQEHARFVLYDDGWRLAGFTQ
jgi:hypothetical protein